jgi:predicted membrane protein
MDNKFGGSYANQPADNGYIDFNLWQLIIIGVSLIVIIVNTSISSADFVVWVVNFLLQMAIFMVVASILASLASLIFKRGWASFFAVIFILGSLFGMYDAIRGYNLRKDMEKAYQQQLEQQAAQAQQQQAAQQQMGGQDPVQQ